MKGVFECVSMWVQSKGEEITSCFDGNNIEQLNNKLVLQDILDSLFN